jgi:iron complex outermembrane receptor protein
MNKNIIWVIASICFSTSAMSQNCTYILKGSVTDFHDNSPLSEATIQVKGTNLYAVTNDQGEFTFKNLCLQKYSLIVSHVSCETQTIEVDTHKKQFLRIKLEHHLEELNEVQVKGKVDKTTLTGQEAVIKSAKIEEFSSGSLADITTSIAGVSSLNTGNNIVKPIIHGMHSSRVITIQNGVRMQDQEWGMEHAPTVDVNASQEIILVKGAAALAYSGDAIGGAIVLKPRKIYKVDSLFGKAITSYNSNNRGYTLSSSFSKTTRKGWYFNGQGSYRRFGDAQAPDYNLTNTGLDFKAFSTQAGYSTFEESFRLYYSYVDNEIGVLSSSHIGGIDQLISAINNNVPSTILDFTYNIREPRQRIRHHLVKASYEKRFSGLGKLTLQYDYQNNRRQEFDRRRGDFSGVPSIDLLLQTHGFQSKFSFDKNVNSKYNVGVQMQLLDNFADPATGVRRLIPDYDRFDLGAFVTTEWKLNNDFLVEAAVRYDYNHIDAKKFYRIISWNERGYDQDFADIIVEQRGAQYLTNPVYDFHNISASLGVKKSFDQHEFALNYSVSNRAPNASEFFSDGLHQSVARVEIGNLRLDKETANQLSAIYTYQDSKINLQVEPYLNRISNYIFIAPTQQGITAIGQAGFFLEYEFLSTDAFIYGVDFNLDYSISDRISFQNSTAFIVGEDLNNDEPLIDMPPFNTRNTIQYQYSKWKSLRLELTSDFFSGQNNFPDYNFFFTIPSTSEQVLVDVSTPPDAYHLLHFRGSIQTQFTKKSTLEIGLNVQNILNTNYRNYLNRLRFFADELGRNFQIQLKINY